MELVLWFLVGFLIADMRGQRKRRSDRSRAKKGVGKIRSLDTRPIGRRERWAWLATFTGCAALVWFVLT